MLDKTATKIADAAHKKPELVIHSSDLPAAAAVGEVLSATERPDYFSVTPDSEILVKSSKHPRCDAARVLHRLGFPDDALLVSHKEGSQAEYSMRGPLGEWRKSRVREDRNGTSFAKYEPFTSARVSKTKAKRSSLPDQGTTAQGDEPSPPPGATGPATQHAGDINPAADEILAAAPEWIEPIHFEFAHDIGAIHGGTEDQLGGALLAQHQPTKKKTTGD
jgi:hypothetical protein